MTISELEEMLSDIKDKSMEAVLQCEDGTFRSVCFVNTKVITVQLIDEETLDDSDEEFPTKNLLLMAHCTCDEDECELPELGDINSQPELN